MPAGKNWKDRVEHGNNVIVITSNHLPSITYDKEGNLSEEPDFSALRATDTAT